MRPPIICLLAVLAGVSWPLGALAQGTEPTTRAEALRKAREQKQQELTPNRPDALQRGLDFVEDHALYLLTREGFYPKLGSLTTGSGFAYGLGYRDRELFRRNGVAEVWAAGSLRQYWAIQARAAFPDAPRRAYVAEVTADVREYPRELFFGLGPDSRRDNETRYQLRSTDFSGRAGLRLLPVVLAGGNLGLFSPRVETGTIDYLRSGAFVEVDYREPKYARRGGWYRLDFNHFGDRADGAFSFRRTDIDLRQFFGFLSDRRVIALRAFVATTDASEQSSGVPFFLMPTLGGNDSLRGFKDYRFRGPHALLLQAEYRWELWSGLDAALFYDAGKVAMRRADLNFKQLEDDYGFGFRFNTSEGIILRVDAAFGSREGKHLHIVFGGVF